MPKLPPRGLTADFFFTALPFPAVASLSILSVSIQMQTNDRNVELTAVHTLDSEPYLDQELLNDSLSTVASSA